jgi:membrane-associated HD superfamily phosphohydrolase
MIPLVSLVFVGLLVLPFVPSIHFVSPVSHNSCRSSCSAWIFGFSMATVIMLLLGMVQCFYSSSSPFVPFVLLFLLSYFFPCFYRSSIGIFRLLPASVAMHLWFLYFPFEE